MSFHFRRQKENRVAVKSRDYPDEQTEKFKDTGQRLFPQKAQA